MAISVQWNLITFRNTCMPWDFKVFRFIRVRINKVQLLCDVQEGEPDDNVREDPGHETGALLGSQGRRSPLGPRAQTEGNVLLHWTNRSGKPVLYRFYCYTGSLLVYQFILPVLQVEYLISKHHIYLMKSGRISLCGLNSTNIQYFVDAVKDALTVHPERD